MARHSAKAGMDDLVRAGVVILEFVSGQARGVQDARPRCVGGAGKHVDPPGGAVAGESAEGARLLQRGPGDAIHGEVDLHVLRALALDGNAVDEGELVPVASRQREREERDGEAPHRSTPREASGPP